MGNRIPHYVVCFAKARPKSKGFEDRDEMLRFLSGIDRSKVSAIKINGHKQADSRVDALFGVAKRKTEKRDFSQIALSVVEKATGGKPLIRK